MVSPVHIVFAVDKNYAPFIVPVLFQLRKFETKCDSIKIVVAEDVNLSFRELLLDKAKSYGFRADIVETNILNDLYAQRLLKNRTHVSYFTYVKLFLPQILDQVDQILYLDVDILIRGDVNNLLQWNLKSPVAAVSELGSNGKKLFNSDEFLYFNAGILRMSLKRCREISLSVDAEKLIIEKNGRFEFQDQDVFNFLLKNNFDVLPYVYNVFHENITLSPKINIFQNPIIVHFNGPAKPWKNEVYSSFVEEWRRDFLQAGGDLSVLGVAETASEPRLDFSLLISKVRFSSTGIKLRQHLPYFIKKILTELFYTAYRLSKKHNPQVLHALFTQTPDLLEEANSEKPLEKMGHGTGYESLPVVTEVNKTVEYNDRITFIVSQARSGTNALQEFVSTLSKSIITLGELFGGHDLPSEITQIIGHKYPQLVPFDWKSKTAALADWSEVYRAFAQHQSLVDSQAFNVIDDLLIEASLSECVFFIKIFPGQLSTEKFNELLEVYRPRVIVLKRRMIFSYASVLKARITGHYEYLDNSDVEISLREKDVANYIAESTEWFTNIEREVLRLNTPSIDITYEGFFESGEDVHRVKEFINGSIPVKFDVDKDAIRMTVQDRRKDRYLGAVFQQFANLPRKMQKSLILHPGNLVPGADDGAKMQVIPSGLSPVNVNFLHISKCAGTEIKRYIENINIKFPNVLIKSHWHDVNLDQIPEGEHYFFSIRNPTTRFVSEFYSRKRKGRPKYDSEWSFQESSAFAKFPHANLLAESLFLNSIEGDAARRAMSSIGFLWKNQIDWFSQQANFLITRPPLHIIRQENFNKDLSSLLRKLEIGPRLTLKQDFILSHMNDYSDVPKLSDLAMANLAQWFEQDFKFYQSCCDWIEENKT